MLLIIGTFTVNCGGGSTTGSSSESFNNKAASWQSREVQDKVATEIIRETLEFEKAWDKIRRIIASSHRIHFEIEEKGDYWKTSEEFIQDKYHGDCEDVAIYYYSRIRRNGSFSDNDVTMRVVDNYYDNDKASHHVIISVYTQGETIIIDNGIVQTETEEHTKITTEFNLFAIWG
jgi:predicted transglutaminase-like cysteine proteinase